MKYEFKWPWNIKGDVYTHHNSGLKFELIDRTNPEKPFEAWSIEISKGDKLLCMATVPHHKLAEGFCMGFETAIEELTHQGVVS